MKAKRWKTAKALDSDKAVPEIFQSRFFFASLYASPLNPSLHYQMEEAVLLNPYNVANVLELPLLDLVDHVAFQLLESAISFSQFQVFLINLKNS